MSARWAWTSGSTRHGRRQALDRGGAGGAATSIALVRAHEGLPAGVETGIRFVTPDADDLHSGLRASGVDADDVLRWDGVPPMFAFRDLDGNGMEIVEQR